VPAATIGFRPGRGGARSSGRRVGRRPPTAPHRAQSGLECPIADRERPWVSHLPDAIRDGRDLRPCRPVSVQETVCQPRDGAPRVPSLADPTVGMDTRGRSLSATGHSRPFSVARWGFGGLSSAGGIGCPLAAVPPPPPAGPVRLPPDAPCPFAPCASASCALAPCAFAPRSHPPSHLAPAPAPGSHLSRCAAPAPAACHRLPTTVPSRWAARPARASGPPGPRVRSAPPARPARPARAFGPPGPRVRPTHPARPPAAPARRLDRPPHAPYLRGLG
jgi:hypothetical protein